MVGFANLFNMNAACSFIATAFVDVGIELPFIGGVWKNVLDMTLFEAELFNFSYEAPHVQPTLAHQQGSTLYLHSGPDAGSREYFNTDDGNETFIISGSDGTVNVEFDDWYQTFTGVTEVVADMGAGNDVFDATRLSGATVSVTGGAGDDKLYAGSAGRHTRRRCRRRSDHGRSRRRHSSWR